MVLRPLSSPPRSFSSHHLSMASIMVVDSPGFQNPRHQCKDRAATFEELCHNYAHERLQLLCHQRTFVSTLERYRQVRLAAVEPSAGLWGACESARVAGTVRSFSNPWLPPVWPATERNPNSGSAPQTPAAPLSPRTAPYSPYSPQTPGNIPPPPQALHLHWRDLFLLAHFAQAGCSSSNVACIFPVESPSCSGAGGALWMGGFAPALGS